MAAEHRPTFSSALYGQLRLLAGLGAVDLALIDPIIFEQVAERLGKADERLADARALLHAGRPLAAICAAYYVAYHAARAAVFAIAKDDVAWKEDLEKAIRRLLGDADAASLAGLRKARNAAEYHPQAGFSDPASEAPRCIEEAERLLAKWKGAATA